MPVSKEDMVARNWYWYDFLLVTGDAYVDHPSFGAAVISRVLEADGFRVAILSQPDWRDASAFSAMGKPKLGVLVTSGNLDSMVAHYTASKRHRRDDYYSPGKKAGLRPDRAAIVYANRAREAFGESVPIILGGLEASLRRFAHYDYWDDSVRRSVIFDARADVVVFGMGEQAIREIAARLKKKKPVSEFGDIRGTAYVTSSLENAPFETLVLPSYEDVSRYPREYANSARIEYSEHDPVRGRALAQAHGGRYVVVNPPAAPLQRDELDRIAELPYMREWHPMYADIGGVPAIDEVRFSIIHNRGCFGDCAFCALAFHQGRVITSRSHASVVREAQEIAQHPEFKGYIHDVGGPTANFRAPSCSKQAEAGMCGHRRCLTPEPCPNLNADHSDYLTLLRRLRAIPGIKKVFVRSGIRYDYMLEDESGEFFSELVRHHISGQLKVAPEHCSESVLNLMGKPKIEVYESFMERYAKYNKRYDKEQYVVPYLMSSHPGSTLADAVSLAEYLNKKGVYPEQVQDFYPTPGTLATAMYHTGLDPMTMEKVYVAKTPREKELQRALLQWRRPDRRRIAAAALKEAGRDDLIGYGRECLIRPERKNRRK